MWFKYPFIIVLFFLLSLLQASFFPFFAIYGATPNLIFTFFFIFIFFAPKNTHFEVFGIALIAGILSDMFLASFFGVSIASLLAVYFAYQIVGHFTHPDPQQYPIFYFGGTFCAAFTLYAGLLHGAGLLFNFETAFGSVTFVSLAYSLPIALAGFTIGSNFFAKRADKQLKLL